jgi:hypothetical protein
MTLENRCIGSFGEWSRAQAAGTTSLGAGTFANVTTPNET